MSLIPTLLPNSSGKIALLGDLDSMSDADNVLMNFSQTGSALRQIPITARMELAFDIRTGLEWIFDWKQQAEISNRCWFSFAG